MLLKTRQFKRSDRGIYIQDTELLNTDFEVGSNFTYFIDIKNKIITIRPSNNSKNTVSKRDYKSLTKPVIDIRSKQVLHKLQGFDQYLLEIYTDKIILKALTEVNTVENEVTSYKISEVTSVNCDTLGSVVTKGGFTKQTEIALEVTSLFSGAGLLDKGFADAGFKVLYAIDTDKGACETYKYNIGDHIICKDILLEDSDNIIKAPIVIGGVPCTKFSNSNRVDNLCYINNPQYGLLDKYIDTINQNENCKVFVLENVPQILTCSNGKFFESIKQRLKGFSITSHVLNAANFGCAQLRERAIIIGSKIGPIHLKDKLLNEIPTVRDEFRNLTDLLPNQLDYSQPRDDTVEKMSYVPQGGNIFNIPISIRPSGQHSNCYKRLEWDKPSITITNPRKSMLLHPEKNRILSVRECARLQGLPDTFVFKGTLSSKQQQVANGVPYRLARYVAEMIKLHVQRYNKYI